MAVQVIISPTIQLGSGENVKGIEVPAAFATPSESVNVVLTALLTLTEDEPVPLPPLVEELIVSVGLPIGAFLATVICCSVKLEAADKFSGRIFWPVYLVCVVKFEPQPDLNISISIFLGSFSPSVHINIPSNTFIPVIYVFVSNPSILFASTNTGDITPVLSSYSAIQSASSAFINQYILSFSLFNLVPTQIALVKPKLSVPQLLVIVFLFES